jgi:hypothetical protein
MINQGIKQQAGINKQEANKQEGKEAGRQRKQGSNTQ